MFRYVNQTSILIILFAVGETGREGVRFFVVSVVNSWHDVVSTLVVVIVIVVVVVVVTGDRLEWWWRLQGG